MKLKTAVIVSVVSVVSVVLLSGCASQSPQIEIEELQAELEAQRASQLEQSQERKNEQLNESLDIVPSWVIAPPKPDVTGIYGVGLAESSNLNMVMKKARLQAEFEIAQQMAQEISGLEQQFSEDATGNEANLRFESVVERFVNSVEIAGQEIVEQDVKVANGKYNGFVLMRLSFDSMERMLEERSTMEGYDRMKAAFKALRERIEASETTTTSVEA